MDEETENKIDLPELLVGSFARNSFGERVCGDVAFFAQKEDWAFLGIIDGLGHGKQANEAAELARDFLTENWEPSVLRTMSKMHEALKGSIGVAAGIASIDLRNNMLHYSGIGNTVLRRMGGNSIRMVSREGVVGIRMRSPIEQELLLENKDVLVLHTDGVSENFELKDYPQMLLQSPAVIAKTIVRKFGNQFDDATCLVVKYSG